MGFHKGTHRFLILPRWVGGPGWTLTGREGVKSSVHLWGPRWISRTNWEGKIRGSRTYWTGYDTHQDRSFPYCYSHMYLLSVRGATISCWGPRQDPHHRKKILLNTSTEPFRVLLKSRICPTTWGSTLYIRPWKTLRFYYLIHKNRVTKKMSTNTVSTLWYISN